MRTLKRTLFLLALVAGGVLMELLCMGYECWHKWLEREGL